MSEEELKRKNIKLLRKKSNIKYTVNEYKKCKNKTHLLVGITMLIGLLPIPGLLKIMEAINTKTFIILTTGVALSSLYGSIKTKKHFKNKMKNLKLNNPEIDFENFTEQNLDVLDKEIQALNNMAIQEVKPKKIEKQNPKEKQKPKVYQSLTSVHTQVPNPKGYTKTLTLKRRG